MRRWHRPVFRPRFRPRPWLGIRWRRPLRWGWWPIPLVGVLACLAVMILPMVVRLFVW
jgi:hypothetical protein